MTNRAVSKINVNAGMQDWDHEEDDAHSYPGIADRRGRVRLRERQCRHAAANESGRSHFLPAAGNNLHSRQSESSHLERLVKCDLRTLAGSGLPDQPGAEF